MGEQIVTYAIAPKLDITPHLGYTYNSWEQGYSSRRKVGAHDASYGQMHDDA